MIETYLFVGGMILILGLFVGNMVISFEGAGIRSHIKFSGLVCGAGVLWPFVILFLPFVGLYMVWKDGSVL